MNTQTMPVGIIQKDEFIKRTIAIAKGQYKPTKHEPKIWFESLKSMAQVLSNENQELLRIIIKHKPSSLSELEALSHRKKPNLSRTLKTLAKYGIVEISKVKGCLVPKVKATDFKIEFGLHNSKYNDTAIQ